MQADAPHRRRRGGCPAEVSSASCAASASVRGMRRMHPRIVAQLVSAPGWGPGGRRFESGRSDGSSDGWATIIQDRPSDGVGRHPTFADTLRRREGGHGLVAQPVEHRVRNAKAAGSTPARSTRRKHWLSATCRPHGNGRESEPYGLRGMNTAGDSTIQNGLGARPEPAGRHPASGCARTGRVMMRQ